MGVGVPSRHARTVAGDLREVAERLAPGRACISVVSDHGFAKTGAAPNLFPRGSHSHGQRTQKIVLLAGRCLAGADFLPAAGALVGLQNLLAQPDGLRRDLHVLVVGNKFDGLLEAQFAVRDQANGFVGAG